MVLPVCLIFCFLNVRELTTHSPVGLGVVVVGAAVVFGAIVPGWVAFDVTLVGGGAGVEVTESAWRRRRAAGVVPCTRNNGQFI